MKKSILILILGLFVLITSCNSDEEIINSPLEFRIKNTGLINYSNVSLINDGMIYNFPPNISPNELTSYVSINNDETNELIEVVVRIDDEDGILLEVQSTSFIIIDEGLNTASKKYTIEVNKDGLMLDIILIDE